MTSVESRPQPSPSVIRARMIRERQKTSIFWKLVHLLGSLQLALTLLGTIAIAIAIATFYESSFSAKIAQAYIYKAPWFIFWLGILCINLFAVTLTRWPWEKQHTGFIITHYGIITLLIGAVVGSRMGFEGNVTLNEKATAPVTRITTSKSVLQVESPSDGAMFVRPFDAELLRPSEDRPRTLAVPGSNLVIVTDAYSANLVSTPSLEPSETANARSGVVLKMKSAMASQSEELPLVLRADGGMEEDFFGLATISYLPELVDRTPKMVAETQMVFANYAPVIQSETSDRTGVEVELSKDAAKITLRSAEGTSATYSLKETLGKTLQTGAATVRIENYWPDFKMENGLPRSISQQPNNPAVIARVSGPAQVAETEGSPLSDKPLLELAPNPEGTAVNYQLSRRGIAYGGGQIKQDETIQLGWADWTAHLSKFLPKAEIVNEIKPGGENVEGIPGFRAWLRSPDGTDGPKRWVESGSIPNLTLGKTIVRIGYGLELKPIPFSITLKNFEVPRFEGTETPANYIATVEFKDRETGATKEDVAKMNKPASWPGGAFAQITGLNYKFSQAEWNPKDLGETTLQVLYDPGWLLKWVGSLAICIGIFTMFYLRPSRQTAP